MAPAGGGGLGLVAAATAGCKARGGTRFYMAPERLGVDAGAERRASSSDSPSRRDGPSRERREPSSEAPGLEQRNSISLADLFSGITEISK